MLFYYSYTLIIYDFYSMLLYLSPLFLSISINFPENAINDHLYQLNHSKGHSHNTIGKRKERNTGKQFDSFFFLLMKKEKLVLHSTQHSSYSFFLNLLLCWFIFLNYICSIILTYKSHLLLYNFNFYYILFISHLFRFWFWQFAGGAGMQSRDSDLGVVYIVFVCVVVVFM